MTRTVSDAAVILGLLTGMDIGDEASKAGTGKELQKIIPGYLDAEGLQGPKDRCGKEFFRFSTKRLTG